MVPSGTPEGARRRRLIWKFFPVYFLINLVSLMAIGGVAAEVARRVMNRQQHRDLEARARYLGKWVSALDDRANLKSLIPPLGAETETRITLISRSGQALADSHQDAAAMDNHLERPEVAEALEKGVGERMRFSQTLGRDMMYVALRLDDEPAGAAIVRVSLTKSYIDQSIGGIYRRIAWAVVIVFVAAAVAGVVISNWISRPLEVIRRGAERFARGDLDLVLPIPDSLELADLADTMNQRSAQLRDRIDTLRRERSEREAVFASMAEGVVAVDEDERVIVCNAAAAWLLGIAGKARGQKMEAVVADEDLRLFARRVLAGERDLNDEITLKREGKVLVRVSGRALRGAQGRDIGALIVLDDITRLRQLENIRRDFVSNVSHELRTPITSIKGFVETLLDGAMDNRDDLVRFLGIISKHVSRLGAIIDDLLSLSRIEQEIEDKHIHLTEGMVAPILESSVMACEVLARDRNVDVVLDTPERLRGRINPTLLEQAVVNLIDNAIKYSPSGGRVVITAREDSKEIIIEVRDQGRGIAEEFIPRLFERFYRVDQARSRELGGTGLGLAIVKHIVNAHGGRVTVESKEGEGSVFRIHLPR